MEWLFRRCRETGVPFSRSFQQEGDLEKILKGGDR